MKKIAIILACMPACFSLFTGCTGMKSRLEDTPSAPFSMRTGEQPQQEEQLTNKHKTAEAKAFTP